MNDREQTVEELRKLVERFIDERNWIQFHTPKNLSMSLAIEAAELMEHFQWLTPEQSLAIDADDPKRLAIEEELADVLSYLLAMSSRLGIDLAEALVAKMEKNAVKYPIEEYRGRFGPDDPRFA